MGFWSFLAMCALILVFVTGCVGSYNEGYDKGYEEAWEEIEYRMAKSKERFEKIES